MTSSWTSIRRGLRYQFGSFEARDFSGGLNLRDGPSELAPNESPYCKNVTFDERGGVVKRLGLSTLATISNAPARMFWSQSLGRGYIQDGTAIKTTTDFVTYITLATAMGSSATVGFGEFGGKVFVVHPTSGLFWHDGTTSTTLTAIAAGPKGNAMAAWQNALWIIGDPTNPTRVWRSGANDGTDWNEAGAGGAMHVDIRDTNDAALTAIGTGTAIDATAKPTLLVFKSRSTHRINNSSNGSYQTIDARAGASGPKATTSALGYVYHLNDIGVWRSDGLNPPIKVSAKIDPLFSSSQLTFSQLSGAVATTYKNRLLFSIPFGTSATTNTMTLEYHPELGWFSSHSFGLTAAYPFLNNSSKLYGGGNGATKVYDVFKGWDDAGTAYTGDYQTRWFAANGDNQFRTNRVRVFGRGVFGLYFKRDYEISDGQLNNVSLPPFGSVWNSFTWNSSTALWGPSGFEQYQDFHALGLGKACSLMFRDISSTSATGPNLLGTGAGDEVGSFACYGFQMEYAPLGLS